MKNKKGFTLAELLIVVAIIGVLVAISIPIYITQKKKVIFAVNQANVRSGYAAAVAEMLTTGKGTTDREAVYHYDISKGKIVQEGDRSYGHTAQAPAGEHISTDVWGWILDKKGFIGDRVWKHWWYTFKDSELEIVGYSDYPDGSLNEHHKATP